MEPPQKMASFGAYRVAVSSRSRPKFARKTEPLIGGRSQVSDVASKA